MSAVEKSEERREYRRISDAIALMIHQPDGATSEQEFDAMELPEHPTHVVSLNPNGLKCYHDRVFTDGDVHKLRIRLFPGGNIIEARARVASSGEEETPNKNNRFFAGLVFVGLSLEQKEQLRAHIEAITRESFGGVMKLVSR